METMERRIAVRGIVFHNNKLLLVRQKHKSIVSDEVRLTWCLPGGGLSENESLIDGLGREMIEETGIKPVIGNLLFINQFNGHDRDNIELYFHIKNSKDYLNTDLSKTSHGQAELEEIDFKEPKKTNISPKFLMEVDIVDQIKNDRPIKIFSF
ncbi:MAG: NUDIX domain-containing protein [bacterium]